VAPSLRPSGCKWWSPDILAVSLAYVAGRTALILRWVIKLPPPLTVTGTGIDQGLALHADGVQTVC
jgi:hypothetical protein